MNRVAANFLTRSFASCETVALLLRRDNTTLPQQRIVKVEQLLAPRYLAWLGYENDNGSNVYVSANPLHPGSRKRTKECVASVRHLYIDIDDDGDARLATLRASDRLPTPTAIISTSPGKYQALWHVAGFDFEHQEEMLKLIAQAFGGDPACTDRNRVLRVPGFMNRKYSPAHPVAVEYPADAIYTPADFRLDDAVCSSVLPLCENARKPPVNSTHLKHSHSEDDWGWVCARLAHGQDASKLTHELAARRSDKSDPLYYAQRTVDVASARLWLADGIPIDDIITMLEVRRSFEIPAALCSARAREIAATAQRMIARQKTA
ncbi:DNA-primase RepB domain-containing protein [Telmatobacter bradus]|uniref:DNA-primase RepB domain-containing protein n=1 Tax=Telmatobacter bradus TaxID=474953 RepID=UPI003B4320C6